MRIFSGSFVVLLSLTTTTSTSLIAAAELGLFVTTRWRKWTTLNNSDICDASSCSTRLQEGCLPQVVLRVEHLCYKYANFDFTLDLTPTREVMLEGETEFCSVDCENGEFIVSDDGDVDPSSCRGGLTSLRECRDDDVDANPSLSDVVYLPNYCMETTEPKGDFITPLYHNRLYGSEETCEADSSIHISQYFSADGTICHPSIPAVGEERVLGSFTRMCNSDGTTTITRYSDPNCKEQDSNFDLPIEWTIDGCTPPDDATSESSGAPDDVDPHYRADCQSPKVFCKDLSAINLYSKVETEDNDGDGAVWTSANMVSSSIYFVVMVALTLLF